MVCNSRAANAIYLQNILIDLRLIVLFSPSHNPLFSVPLIFSQLSTFSQVHQLEDRQVRQSQQQEQHLLELNRC